MSVDKYDAQSKEIIKYINGLIAKYFNGYYVDVSALMYNIKASKRKFRFRDNPELNKEFNAINKKLKIEIESIVNNGITRGWELAELKGNAVDAEIATYLASKGFKRKPIRPQSSSALAAFKKRRLYGLTLSDRVWKIADQNKSRIEDIIEIAITEGKSARSLANRLLEFLQNDYKLFEAAKKDKAVKAILDTMHYGRGVYKNPMSNAMRLAQNEINIAYRTAEIERIKTNNDVVGYEVYLSPSHKIYDMCDVLKGRYPKNFVFTNWHVGCMCNVRPILKTRAEILKEMQNNESLPADSSINYVDKPHKDFYRYLSDEKDVINRMKNKPDWITANLGRYDIKSELD